jgi:hypothetical protein
MKPEWQVVEIHSRKEWQKDILVGTVQERDIVAQKERLNKRITEEKERGGENDRKTD